MKIKAEIILPHVYLLTFESQYDLCMSFVRIQEFYESPRFRGKYFTLEDYIDYWSKNFGHGSFTYPSVWNGFNIPGDVLYNWKVKFADDFRDKEIDILNKIEGLMRKETGKILIDDIKKVYVIGMCKKGTKKEMRSVVDHELAHSMYFLYPKYKKNCDNLLKKVDKKTLANVKKALLKMGYCNKMINDEMQAYFSVGGMPWLGIKERKDFRKNFILSKKRQP